MEKIHDTLTSAIDHCMPYNERTISHKQIRREPWLSASIKISIDCNKRLYGKMLRHECSLEKYKNYNLLLRKIIRTQKPNSTTKCAGNISHKQKNCEV